MNSRNVTGRDIAHLYGGVIALLGPALTIALAVLASVLDGGEMLLSPFTVGWFGALSLAGALTFYFTAPRTPAPAQSQASTSDAR